ncbi:hypothetical protein IWQ57_002715 [Coemansia nantahalensis]|uniref:Uncharacterized protein n=1 Tax=Coemansia nantahalensis TaxID=2789366 RepID=A0ACC1JZF3_9FUNG|nr:hypothetical protein IWQ57_002715 [Coemansia nantahalensis]
MRALALLLAAAPVLQRRGYRAVRHSSLLPQTWVISGGNAAGDHAAAQIAAALGLPHHTKPALAPRLPVPLARALASLGELTGVRRTEVLQFVGDAHKSDLPRFVVAASKKALPGLMEVKRLTKGRTTAVYIGLPDVKLAKIDVLVLSRIEQMVLRRLGPARANLDNAVGTVLPLSGIVSSAPPPPAPPPTVVVCVGSGVESAGFRLLSTDMDNLADGLAHIPPSRIRIVLSPDLHPRLRPMVESQLVRRMVDAAADVEVLDYAQPGQQPPPPLVDVIAAATQVIATADYVAAVSVAAALRRPIYIAGEERTRALLRDYYHLLESKNLVRRFYPKGSRYSYMLAPEIRGSGDVFSAIRDHEPWAAYDAKADLDNVVEFIRTRYKEKIG